MVDVRVETESEARHRLALVLVRSQIRYFAEPYCFVEWPIDQGVGHDPRHIALVRDDAMWSALTPSAHDHDERFFVWSIEFPLGQDNSGFVGWLATSLKRALGTGVIVVCGFNSRRGGIYDYWGCPWHMRTEVAEQINYLTFQESGAAQR